MEYLEPSLLPLSRTIGEVKMYSLNNGIFGTFFPSFKYNYWGGENVQLDISTFV